MMKKLLLSAVVILSFLGYALRERTPASPSQQSTPLAQPSNQSQSLTDPLLSLPPASPTSRPAISTNAQLYKDGTYTGSVADAFYGNVQVQVEISQGKIISLNILDYPKDRRTSLMISNQALPILKNEVLSTQNARVDSVSGATQTSRAFRESLQSALTQAEVS